MKTIDVRIEWEGTYALTLLKIHNALKSIKDFDIPFSVTELPTQEGRGERSCKKCGTHKTCSYPDGICIDYQPIQVKREINRCPDCGSPTFNRKETPASDHPELTVTWKECRVCDWKGDEQPIPKGEVET